MKYFVKTFTLGILAVFLFLVTPLADAQEFKGLWEGIDETDGSSIVVSIADKEGDGEYEILWRETHFWRCEKDGQGIVRGTATTNSNGHLVIDALLYCLDGSKGGGIRVIPTLAPDNGDYSILTLVTTGNSDLTLHRISSRW